ncbi:ATP-binding protein [Formosa sp. PL04]|uniref:ATP-binding protein n=1 Tax=Formosa sp. PL04 TaxID=3081755 RepID=UPI002980FAD5|nr:ATP-binding protein [Formosa sp. PL04]MDW5288777.1 ATP-binding protein [Formosa sp. PL04]
MRYLNKIVFINSASVKYAEIELDGNVHLIGTQGVGKSTLLRAILFFYNANKSKLGIPREKKGFDDYYFEYQNSYIIYEIIKDNIPFCVLAYKVNGKVAFRFFNSGYKRALFVDDNNRAFESWDKIRNAFGKEIHYTSLISSYEEFRKIIYGDNKGLKSDFRKYALVESKQYQNIPRTIQNVLLNSNLEAKFIKDTIINSLNEDEFTIDIENYSKNHLRDFESQINDIKIWFKKNKKGQIVVRNQADKIIDKYRVFNFLKREKKELALNLAGRMDFIEKEKPTLSVSFIEENKVLNELFNKKENLEKIHKRREQDLISKMYSISEKLKETAKKEAEYNAKNIHVIIEEVSKKETLMTEQKTLENEKNLLTSKFTEVNQKYEALISQLKNKQQEFTNHKDAEINKLRSDFVEDKTSLFEIYENLIKQIKEDNKAEKEQFVNELQGFVDDENRIKRKKAELKHQIFFVTEIENCKEETKELNAKISSSKNIVFNAINETTTLRKEWDLEVKDVKRVFDLKVDKDKITQLKYREKIQAIENKIKQSKSSLYGWLHDNIPNWENNIGKVIDEEQVLFNTELNPKLSDNKSSNVYGLELNLSAIKSRVKTVKEYHQEIDEYNVKVNDVQKSISELNSVNETDLQKLKIRFKKKLKELKETIAENEYIASQSEDRLKKNKIELEDWMEKSNSEKATILQNSENDLDKIVVRKSKSQENLEKLKKGINRKISLKETERNKEISVLEKIISDKIENINTSVFKLKEESELRINVLQKNKITELDDKGADTKRLSLIDDNLNEINRLLNDINTKETIVIEFKKDKRELFDKVPQLKADKISLEKKQATILEEHRIELQKFIHKYQHQKEMVESIKLKIDLFEADLNAFVEFKKSDAFVEIESFIFNPIIVDNHFKTAVVLIKDIFEKHSRSLQVYEDLRQAVNLFNGNFDEHNVFRFVIKLISKEDFLIFSADLKEFIEADKISEYETRVNRRFADIIQLIGRETTELNSKEAEIEKIIKKINDDFLTKNFVEAIKEMEMRTEKSSNPIVKLLIEIKDFNDENSLILGETNLFTCSNSNSKNQKAVDLLKQLVNELGKHKNSSLTLSESFDLQFRIVENDNDSGWVEKLSNVGSEGTDVLVKAMINILLLNVFKESASKKIKDFKLHCMMDEIGRLHPNNVKGILRFANERNILLINGSPTSQNATDYKYTYKLAKEQSKTEAKKYITKINRLVKIKTKVLN